VKEPCPAKKIRDPLLYCESAFPQYSKGIALQRNSAAPVSHPEETGASRRKGGDNIIIQYYCKIIAKLCCIALYSTPY
jgi:hypothetical protein